MSRYRPYPEYKESDVEWLGEVPEHWSHTKLSYITTCLDGKRIPLNAEQRGTMQGDFPYWGANGIVDYLNDYLFDEELVLVGEDGAPFFEKFKDVAFVVNEKIWVNNHAHILRSDKRKVNSTYLAYSLNQTDWHLYITGSTRDKLTQTDMNRIALRFPPIEEQTAIADFLDREAAKIDILIAKQQRLIALLKEKRQAVISHAVTKGLDPDVKMKESGVEWLGEVPELWEITKMKYVIKQIESGTSVNAANVPASENELGVLKTSCVYTGNFDPKENKTVVPEETGRVSCQLKINTLIVSRMNTPDLVGAAALVKEASNNIFLPDRLWQVSFISVNPAFMHFLTLTDVYRGYIKTVCAGTSASMQNLSQDDFRDFAFALPNIVEQNRIIDFLDTQTAKIDTLIEKAEKAITLLQERRTALISAAVTGKIDVRGEVA